MQLSPLAIKERGARHGLVKPSTRIYVILARKAHFAVVFRRGWNFHCFWGAPGSDVERALKTRAALSRGRHGASGDLEVRVGRLRERLKAGDPGLDPAPWTPQ